MIIFRPDPSTNIGRKLGALLSLSLSLSVFEYYLDMVLLPLRMMKSSSPSFFFTKTTETTKKTHLWLPSLRRPPTTLIPSALFTTREEVKGEVETRKMDLLRSVQETQRGLVATSDQKASIEEILVDVEGCNGGSSIDLQHLDGTWRLQYTSAADVLVLLDAANRFPFFQVGQIFQKFECVDKLDGGTVRNVVRWSIPTLLEENEGAALVVTASFSVVSKRNIYLQFNEAGVADIKISEAVQALIAPAILPRTFLSLQILQFIRAFRAEVPLRSPGRRSVGGLYYLSFLDNNMLLGRALGSGGVFVFTKAPPLVL